MQCSVPRKKRLKAAVSKMAGLNMMMMMMMICARCARGPPDVLVRNARHADAPLTAS